MSNRCGDCIWSGGYEDLSGHLNVRVTSGKKTHFAEERHQLRIYVPMSIRSADNGNSLSLP